MFCLCLFMFAACLTCEILRFVYVYVPFAPSEYHVLVIVSIYLTCRVLDNNMNIEYYVLVYHLAGYGFHGRLKGQRKAYGPFSSPSTPTRLAFRAINEVLMA